MSDRRQARSRTASLMASPDSLPAALAIGRCIEVWAEDPSAQRPDFTARRRFDRARRAWLDAAGITNSAERLRMFPLGACWSIEYLSYHGQAERAGSTVDEIVTSHLARAGVQLSDIPRLRREAQALLDRST